MRITLRKPLHEVYGDQKISRDELARRMGISSATAFRIERGDVDPSPKFIAALILHTGQTFESLFNIVGQDAA